MLRPFENFGTDYLFLDDETHKMQYITSEELSQNISLQNALKFCRYATNEIDLQSLGMFRSDNSTAIKMENGETWVYTHNSLFRLYRMYGFDSESLLCDGTDLISGIDLFVEDNCVFFIFNDDLCACVSNNYLRFGDCYIDVIDRRQIKRFFLTGDSSTFTRLKCGEKMLGSKFKRLVLSSFHV